MQLGDRLNHARTKKLESDEQQKRQEVEFESFLVSVEEELEAIVEQSFSVIQEVVEEHSERSLEQHLNCLYQQRETFEQQQIELNKLKLLVAHETPESSQNREQQHRLVEWNRKAKEHFAWLDAQLQQQANTLEGLERKIAETERIAAVITNAYDALEGFTSRLNSAQLNLPSDMKAEKASNCLATLTELLNDVEEFRLHFPPVEGQSESNEMLEVIQCSADELRTQIHAVYHDIEQQLHEKQADIEEFRKRNTTAVEVAEKTLNSLTERVNALASSADVPPKSDAVEGTASSENVDDSIALSQQQLNSMDALHEEFEDLCSVWGANTIANATAAKDLNIDVDKLLEPQVYAMNEKMVGMVDRIAVVRYQLEQQLCAAEKQKRRKMEADNEKIRATVDTYREHLESTWKRAENAILQGNSQNLNLAQIEAATNELDTAINDAREFQQQPQHKLVAEDWKFVPTTFDETTTFDAFVAALEQTEIIHKRLMEMVEAWKDYERIKGATREKCTLVAHQLDNNKVSAELCTALEQAKEIVEGPLVREIFNNLLEEYFMLGKIILYLNLIKFVYF